MFGFIKRFLGPRLRIAEVDGITFYLQSSLDEYLRCKERKEGGKRLYTLRNLDDRAVTKATNMLESVGCFDYEIDKEACWPFIELRYYADKMILRISPERRMA